MRGNDASARAPGTGALFAARAVRTFAFGAASLVLALHLVGQGLEPAQVGAVLTACLVEDALLVMAVASWGRRLGARRILVGASFVLGAAGLLLALGPTPALATIAVVMGILSPSGQDAGPFSTFEQARLADVLPPASRTRGFAWYNLAGFLPSALGALTAGAWLALARRKGIPDEAARRAVFAVYAAAGPVLAALYWRFPRDTPAAPTLPTRFGLHRSRRVVLHLALLQGLDSLAGGFVVQSLLVYWFHVRFGAGPDALGTLFFATNVLSAVSFLAAARIAERWGLLNTMVFTHLPSNVLLMLVPVAPGFGIAAALLLARHLLSQMDVPTRQAYTMALVDPDERPAAAGLAASVRGLSAAVAPALTGLALSSAATGLPFLLAGGLKIVYDLALYARFRSVPLPSSS
jgi:MFS family permease